MFSSLLVREGREERHDVLGQLGEAGTTAELTADPLHPYSQALTAAAPVPDPVEQRSRERIEIAADLPDPADPPSGCRFRTRCPIAGPECAKTRPLLEGSFRHAVSCLKVDPL